MAIDRSLTSGEKTELYKVYGDGINYDVIRIQVTSLSSLNVVNIDGYIKAISNKNSFEYGLNRAKNCLFGVEFYNNFAYVHYVDNKYDCDFGMNAGVDGIYYKLNRKKH